MTRNICNLIYQKPIRSNRKYTFTRIFLSVKIGIIEKKTSILNLYSLKGKKNQGWNSDWNLFSGYAAISKLFQFPNVNYTRNFGHIFFQFNWKKNDIHKRVIFQKSKINFWNAMHTTKNALLINYSDLTSNLSHTFYSLLFTLSRQLIFWTCLILKPLIWSSHVWLPLLLTAIHSILV